jgi:hypothetical protein
VAREVIVRPEYVELAFSGEINRAVLAAEGRLPPEARAAVVRLKRVLFDFTEITEFDLDPYQLGRSMEQLAGEGLRLAIVSEGPAMFGVGRQIAQWSHEEGTAIAVFRERPVALLWLLHEGAEE